MWEMNAATSEPTKYSPSPTPTTSGLLRRAATTRSASWASTATSVKAPSSRWQTRCIAVVRSTPDCTWSSTRWATTSVSVCETSTWSSASSRARRSAKFSMIPLCTRAMRWALPSWGWALTSVGGPWVAQRVWPIPVVEAGSGWSARTFSRLASLPAFFAVTTVPCRRCRVVRTTRATPAES